MKIEILLMKIRKEKRIKFRRVIKTYRHIQFSFELYRKESKRAVFINGNKNSKSFEYKNRRSV